MLVDLVVGYYVERQLSQPTYEIRETRSRVLNARLCFLFLFIFTVDYKYNMAMLAGVL